MLSPAHQFQFALSAECQPHMLSVRWRENEGARSTSPLGTSSSCCAKAGAASKKSKQHVIPNFIGSQFTVEAHESKMSGWIKQLRKFFDNSRHAPIRNGRRWTACTGKRSK